MLAKPEGKRPLRRPTSRWEVKSKICVKDIRWVDVDWIHLVRDRDKWRSDAVKFSAAKVCGIAWLADELVALHGSLSVVKTVPYILGSEKCCYIRGRHSRKVL